MNTVRQLFWRIMGMSLPLAVVVNSAFGATNSSPTTNVEVVATSPTVVVTQRSVRQTWLTFGLDKIEWLRVDVLGNPLWQYLASFIYIVLAFYISQLLDWIIQVQL